MTRPFACSALVLCLAVNAEAAEILILGGDTTAEGGQQVFESTRAAMKKWERVFVPAPGFPKLIESAKVEGLKPGFFLTVWGVCEKAGALLDVARTTVKGPYVRQVTWPEATLPCPSTSVEGLDSRTVKTKHGELVVVLYNRTGFFGVAALIARDGSISVTKEFFQHGFGCDGVTLAAESGKVTLSAHCITQSCTSPEESDVFVQVTAKNPNELSVKQAADVTSKCVND